jgi:Omp85 superfamily domain
LFSWPLENRNKKGQRMLLVNIQSLFGPDLRPNFIFVFFCSASGGHVEGNFSPHEAFAIGGTNSVRGYEEGAVGSGRSYAVGSGELSFRMVRFAPLPSSICMVIDSQLKTSLVKAFLKRIVTCILAFDSVVLYSKYFLICVSLLIDPCSTLILPHQILG